MEIKFSILSWKNILRIILKVFKSHFVKSIFINLLLIYRRLRLFLIDFVCIIILVIYIFSHLIQCEMRKTVLYYFSWE